MEESGFFASINGDRKYKSDLIATFFSKLFTNGVFNNGLQVQANNDMTVTLKSGTAFINGYFYNNTVDKVINISLSDTEQSRIDSIVLRFSKENREIIADVLEGSYADNPIAPKLTRNSNIYELRICNILVNKQADSITSAMIEDCRFNSDDCGNVVQAVQTIDTTNIFAQYEAKFNELFNQMKGILSEDPAGQLLVEINNVKNKVNNILPIGTIIANDDDDFDPNLIYEGTWERIKGCMIIGRDEDDKDFGVSGLTGGSKTHTQTVEELATHNHSVDGWPVRWEQGKQATYFQTEMVYGTTPSNNPYVTSPNTFNMGSGQPMDIMNPYYVANIWRRVA